ncbi:hypothetical protein [Aquimarina algiphila]|uniref:RNA polymerase alpha subunit C-terminal domain-containing protein n=1 Tax=Aquimarina algiphila TaxID=2047982 RepID=A0A554VAJ1_9FLAO|nr:hypothetical protein [Aquimarina algiphila]TSE03175.1 hypothetical protein FOF46_29845 [Aquimarina algiphila]
MQPLILKESIEKLEIEDELKKFMTTHRMTTLEDLLKIKGSELLKMEGFSYRILQSLLAFLHKHDCLHLFEEE